MGTNSLSEERMTLFVKTKWCYDKRVHFFVNGKCSHCLPWQSTELICQMEKVLLVIRGKGHIVCQTKRVELFVRGIGPTCLSEE